MIIIWILLVLAIIAFGFFRLVPSDPAVWHIAPEATVDKTFKTGVIRIVETGPDGLGRLHDIALASPRTKVLAGSEADGMITYIVRSKLFGFPDYVTVSQQDGTLKIYARSRFGGSDAGVNGARTKRWINALQPG